MFSSPGWPDGASPRGVTSVWAGSAASGAPHSSVGGKHRSGGDAGPAWTLTPSQNCVWDKRALSSLSPALLRHPGPSAALCGCVGLCAGSLSCWVICVPGNSHHPPHVCALWLALELASELLTWVFAFRPNSCPTHSMVAVTCVEAVAALPAVPCVLSLWWEWGRASVCWNVAQCLRATQFQVNASLT